jgi:hypothetical protein
MKFGNLVLIGMFFLCSPVSALAQETEAPVTQPDSVAGVEEIDVPASQQTPCPMRGMGMKQKGMGQHGKGHDGMKHGKGKHEKHAEVLQRLDMIEARMAKMEAMLESLMRR